MTVNRRLALAGLGSAALLGASGTAVPRTAEALPLYLSAARGPDGRFHIMTLTGDGARAMDAVLPARGHAAAISPDRHTAIVFARRPGTFALVVDMRDGAPVRQINAAPGRHFYGHGVFGKDGAYLYATENDFDGARGVVGIYNARTKYERLGEMPSHGVGPHDIALADDGETLIVANGGIETHPDAPRVKLNLDSMRPSLTFLRRSDGHLIDEQVLADNLRQLSIRHLARGARGRIAVGLQAQVMTGKAHPLVALSHGAGSGLQFLNMPADILDRMNGYCGSVAFDATGRFLAATSPRGGISVFWDAQTGAYLSNVMLPDCCGVAPAGDAGTFLLTAGTGHIMRVAVGADAQTHTSLLRPADANWDNHLTALL